MTMPPIHTPIAVRLLEPPQGMCDVIIDTDTYNEIDDQFAIVHALLSDNLNIQAIQAAPFHAAVRKTTSFEHGMELSYREIERVLEKCPVAYDGPVLKGSRRSITDSNGSAVHSEAANTIISLALTERTEPLYVLALGALTNVASAILIEPRIRERITVVALGGWPYHVSGFHDFNFIQDIKAAQLVFNSGVALVQVTGFGVSELLRTTRWELMEQVKGHGDIGDYLFQIYEEFVQEHPGRSKPIWDLAPVAWLLNPDWLKTHIAASPILNDHLGYTLDPIRHPIRIVDWLDRDAIFTDFFAKLHAATA